MLVRSHAQLVVNLLHARHAFGDILGQASGVAMIDAAAQRDLAVVHLNFDLAGIDVAVPCQAFVNVFLDAFVGAAIILRTASGITAALGIVAQAAAPAGLRSHISGAHASGAVPARLVAAALSLEAAPVAAATHARAAIAAVISTAAVRLKAAAAVCLAPRAAARFAPAVSFPVAAPIAAFVAT